VSTLTSSRIHKHCNPPLGLLLSDQLSCYHCCHRISFVRQCSSFGRNLLICFELFEVVNFAWLLLFLWFRYNEMRFMGRKFLLKCVAFVSANRHVRNHGDVESRTECTNTYGSMHLIFSNIFVSLPSIPSPSHLPHCTISPHCSTPPRTFDSAPSIISSVYVSTKKTQRDESWTPT